MFHIETIVVGSFACNCRILSDPKTREAIIVDPGDEAPSIIDKIKKRNYTVKALIQTHGHLDHVMATKAVKKVTSAPIYMHKGDLPIYQRLVEQAAMFGMKADSPDPIDHYLEDEMEISISSGSLKTISTPGHSPGSCCFYHADSGEPILLSGDTLFLESVGRTDLWGGNFDILKKSIKQRLYALPDETRVMCGHGTDTTIGHEKRANPFISA